MTTRYYEETSDPRECCCGIRGDYCAVHDIPPLELR